MKSKDNLKNILVKYAKKKKPITSKQRDFLAGTVAGGAATSAFFPLDTWVTRKQTWGPKQWKSYATWSKFTKLKSLYKGMPIKLLKNAPTMGLSLAVYGGAQRYLDKQMKVRKTKK